MDVKSTIKQFIVTEFMHELNQDVLDDESNLIEEGIIDSMGLVEMTTFLNKEFGIKITEDELDIDNFRDVNSLTEFIKQKVNAG